MSYIEDLEQNREDLLKSLQALLRIVEQQIELFVPSARKGKAYLALKAQAAQAMRVIDATIQLQPPDANGKDILGKDTATEYPSLAVLDRAAKLWAMPHNMTLTRTASASFLTAATLSCTCGYLTSYQPTASDEVSMIEWSVEQEYRHRVLVICESLGMHFPVSMRLSTAPAHGPLEQPNQP